MVTYVAVFMVFLDVAVVSSRGVGRKELTDGMDESTAALQALSAAEWEHQRVARGLLFGGVGGEVALES
jgi:hypothetical protein